MEPATCEKIVSRVATILTSQDTQLRDFDIVFAPGDVNTSPVLLVEGNLGLASWCVKHVYTYSYKSVLQDKDKIWKYEDCHHICHWTQFCLLVCPEVCTFWTVRRKLLKKGLIAPEQELLLTRLILSRKPKCLEAFFQRQWIFSKMLCLRPSRNRILLHAERELCAWAAARHQNNYHAWNHRLWLLLEIMLGLEDDGGDCLAVLKVEFDEVKRWVEVHVSEHSGMHYLNKLVEFIVAAAAEGRFSLEEAPPFSAKPSTVYEEMLAWNKSLIDDFPGHEALFYARRTLLLKWREVWESGKYPDTATSKRKPHPQPRSSLMEASSTHNNGCFRTSPPVGDQLSAVGGDAATLCQEVDDGATGDHQQSTLVSGKPTTTSTAMVSCVGGGKMKEPRDCDDNDEGVAEEKGLRSVKRSCVESVSSSEWCQFLMKERSVAEEFVAAGDTCYGKDLARHYQVTLARMAL